jgi:hypothetical protein
VLRAKLKAPSHIHLDAALFGGFLAYAREDLSRLVNQQAQKFDSIAVSVSAFPITYAARLDAVTKLHGISSSMRL